MDSKERLDSAKSSHASLIEAKRKRQMERGCAVRKQKTVLLRGGQNQCEVCGWKAPEYLQTLFGRSRFILNLHHILPVACGGSDEPENLILLCPNHHAMANVLSGRFNKGRGNKHNSFITEREELVQMLRLIDSDPIEWERQMEDRFAQMQADLTNWLSDQLDRVGES